MTQKTLDPPYAANRPDFTSDVSSQGPETGFYNYLHVLRKRKWILIGSIVFALLIASIINLTQKPVYQSSTELVLQAKESPQTSGQNQQGSSFLTDPTFLITQVRLIRSPHLAERILQKLEVSDNRQFLMHSFLIGASRKKNDPSVFSEEERRILLGSIPGSLSVYQVQQGARILAISATGYDPRAVMLIADAAAKSYVEMNYESQVQSFQQSFLMISKSLAEIRGKIKTGEIAIQKVDSEIKLLEALKVYEEKHPLVIQLRSEIPVLAKNLNQGIQNLKTMQFTQRKDLVILLMQPHIEASDLSAIEADLYTLKPILEQEVNTNRGMYDSMFQKLQEVELSGGNTWVDAKVVEPASVPSRPIRPNKKMNLILAFVIGIFIGAGLAFFLEYLDSSIRNLDDVRNYLRLFPLGMVPQVEFTEEGEERSEKQIHNDQLHRPFWLANDMNIPLYVAEAYRIIRTNLAFGPVDISSLKVLQVTSAIKGEGKTTTAANLGISLAQAGVKTLIVDADMRRPSLHRILEFEGFEKGLAEALANGTSWESIVEPTKVTNLFFIPAGTIPPNPAELLSSKRLDVLIEELKKHFDMVIFDSPPVISIADASVIASRVDGIILVSRAGFIPRHLPLQSRNTLQSVNGKIIGCVLNGIQSQHQPYYYYRYYQKYGDYYGETTKKKTNKNKLPKELSSIFEKIQLLKEPFFALVMRGWNQLVSAVKGEERREKEFKSSDGKS